MKDGLEALNAKMSLTEQEKKEIHVETSLLEDAIMRGEICLIIKLLNTKRYNKEAFKQTINKIWRSVKPIRF